MSAEDTAVWHRLDPSLHPVLAGTGPRDFAGLGIQGVRANAAVRRAAARSARQADERVVIADLHGAPVALRAYRPASEPAGAAPHPVVVWFHGGGFMLGGYEDNADLLESFVVATGCVAVSVDYRLAPEHPAPAQLDDAEAAYLWLVGQAATLGLDSGRFVVAGGSAGGCLAAGLTLRLRRTGGPLPVCQLLMYPMLDDRAVTPSRTLDTVVWTVAEDRVALRALLGEAWPDVGVPDDVIPARATDLRGLPRTAIAVGELDLFRDDVLSFAARLYAAGVPTDLAVLAGLPHGPDSAAPGTPAAARLYDTMRSMLVAAIGPPGSGQ